MIKVGIVGCGKIADAHAGAISSIPGCEIVGCCDKEELMAKQLFERFKIGRYYGNLDEMLESSKPDVVHITTPPLSHFEIGRICLNAGCHAYIEKPFTVNSQEAAQLIRLSNEKGLKLTVGTDEQYSHMAIQMRELIKGGYLGGAPVHMEDYYGYDLGDEKYARSFLANNAHWLWSLPGQLLHNIISHGVAKVAEFLTGDDPEIIAHGFTSEFLKKMGENRLIDELRVIINDADRVTAYLTFSSQIGLHFREFRIYGPKNGLIINQDHHSIIKVSGTNYKSYLNALIPLSFARKQYKKNVWANTRLFMKRDFHMKAGLRRLVKRFYQSIYDSSPLPISYREIMLTAKIMDSIFSQIHRR
jgi:predicted dehydrogenase